MKNNKPDRQKGFTIIELLIASSIFGVILLIAMTGIIYIGRTYYKGIVTSRTQEAARSITQEVSDTFQYGGSEDFTAPPPAGGFGAYCIGKFRYTYILNKRVAADDGSGQTSRHALWLDVIKEGAACAPFNINVNGIPGDSNTDSTSADALAIRRELVPPNMRLDRFTMEKPGDRSFLKVDLKVIYGEHELVGPGGVCLANSLGGHFCAVSALNTSVKKRL